MIKALLILVVFKNHRNFSFYFYLQSIKHIECTHKSRCFVLFVIQQTIVFNIFLDTGLHFHITTVKNYTVLLQILFVPSKTFIDKSEKFVYKFDAKTTLHCLAKIATGGIGFTN